MKLKQRRTKLYRRKKVSAQDASQTRKMMIEVVVAEGAKITELIAGFGGAAAIYFSFAGTELPVRLIVGSIVSLVICLVLTVLQTKLNQ